VSHREHRPHNLTGSARPIAALIPTALSAEQAHLPAMAGPCRRPLFVGLVAAALVAATLFATAPSAQAEACPNEARRSEQGAAALALPDCRAYEMVSPLGSSPIYGAFGRVNNNRVLENKGRAQGTFPSLSGDRFGYISTFTPASSTTPGLYFLSTRGQAGWSTENLVPSQSTESGDVCLPLIAGYSADLSKAILADGLGQNSTFNCGADDPPLVAGEPRGFQNVFVRDNEAVSYQLVNVTPLGVTPSDAWFQAGSTDLSRVVFGDQAQLTQDAPSLSQLEKEQALSNYYIFSGGVVRYLAILPDGTPVRGQVVNAAPLPGSGFGLDSPSVYTHAVSANGEHVFWETAEPRQNQFPRPLALFLRENAAMEQSAIAGGECTEPAKACTVQVDASQAGGPGGGGAFQWASADGSEVFFTDDASAGLTADTVPGSGQNLYRYEVETGQLTDLTPVAEAGVLGVSGAAEGASYLYFVAESKLTGEQENSEGAKAQAGQPNLYLSHAGTLTFIAALDRSTDSSDWAPGHTTARVSPDGTFIGFDSTSRLTGYDNTPSEPEQCVENGGGGLPSPAPCQEIFLYGATDDQLSCASCDPGGAPPTGPAGISEPEESSSLNGGYPSQLQRNVADGGRVFFDTSTPLLPRDTNGVSDVYEYANGQQHLISTGTSADASYFYDATPSGNDIFLITAQQLVRRDTDSGVSLYDARVGGGFPEPPPPVACETEEACHTARPELPPTSTPGTAHFEGPGNPRPLICKKGFKRVVRHGREVCVKKHPRHHKHRRRSHKRAARRTANPNRRAAK
jgi:hypothetical protein